MDVTHARRTTVSDATSYGPLQVSTVSGRMARTCAVAIVAAVMVSVLGGCMSFPAVSDPVPRTPGAPQKTIGELLTQWAGLTDAAIAATGVTEGWFRGARLDNKPWDPAAEEVALSPCGRSGRRPLTRLTAW
ncbi:hypothetical protein GCM10027406_18550 [Leifsonia lichenia]